MSLRLVPVDWPMAGKFNEAWHRHHPKPPPGHRFCVGVQAGESGASLRAAGFRVIAKRPPRKGWDTPSRPRDNGSYLSIERYLWEAS